MAIHYRSQAFILKKQNLREADQLFTIFSKDFGKLKILARAIRKIKSKLRGNFQLFSLAEIEFIQGKTYKTLTDAILINNFSGIKKDLKKLKISHQITDLVDNLIRGQEPDQETWHLLKEIFEKLENCSLFIVNCLFLYYYFLWNLLSILGYTPGLYNCSLCQKKLRPEKLYFNSQEGGVICSDCFGNKKTPPEVIDQATIKILRLILKKDWSILQKLKIEQSNLKNLRKVSQNFLSYILSQLN